MTAARGAIAGDASVDFVRSSPMTSLNGSLEQGAAGISSMGGFLARIDRTVE